jgi:hypothetical protein
LREQAQQLAVAFDKAAQHTPDEILLASFATLYVPMAWRPFPFIQVGFALVAFYAGVND